MTSNGLWLIRPSYTVLGMELNMFFFFYGAGGYISERTGRKRNEGRKFTWLMVNLSDSGLTMHMLRGVLAGYITVFANGTRRLCAVVMRRLQR